MIIPDWPAPSTIRACTTVRTGGVSESPYHTFNLADHVGDRSEDVKTNRALLKKMLDLPSEPLWLEQTHSTIVLHAATSHDTKADASFTDQPDQVCAVMTADCLPVLLCNRQGTRVAAIHAGWRGLANGIIENTVRAMNLSPDEVLVWLGPAIGPDVYELGDEVREYFLKIDEEAQHSFIPSRPGHWFGNLYDLARLRLKKLDIHAIYGGEYCTYTDSERFFSYRRDESRTGRMASLIWIR